jgi:hypothetical protein
VNPTALAQQSIKIEFNRIFSLNFLLIFLAALIAALTDQSLNRKIEQVIKSPDGLSNMIWVWGIASLGSSLFFPLLISMLCSYTLSNAFNSKRTMLKEKFELALIETLRAWGKTFLWCFVLIIPGLIKYAFYLLSPFVVFFSKKYAEGKVDALEMSEKIAKKFFWKLNIWVTLFYFLLPIALSATLDEFKVFQFHPISATVCVLFETILIVVFHYLILKLFIRYLNEVENGSIF